MKFHFDYQFDANGHPQQYYCRSDHYEYARYGIPITFFSTGGHRDYHQVTDEPQYIDYDQMAGVAHSGVRRRAARRESRPSGRRRQDEAESQGAVRTVMRWRRRPIERSSAVCESRSIGCILGAPRALSSLPARGHHSHHRRRTTQRQIDVGVATVGADSRARRAAAARARTCSCAARSRRWRGRRRRSCARRRTCG